MLLLALFAAAVAKPAAPLMPVIGVSGYADSQYNEKRYYLPQDMWLVRGGNEAERLADWISPTDPLFRLLKAHPEWEGEAEVLVDFDDAGKATYCMIGKTSAPDQLLTGFCDRLVKRARLVPPLSDDGARHPDQFRLSVHFRPSAADYTVHEADRGKPIGELSPIRLSVPPPPPGSPNFSKAKVEVSGLALFAGDRNSLPTEASTVPIEVAIARDGSVKRCRFSGWSFETKNVDAACALVRTGRYRVTGAEGAEVAYQRMLVIDDGRQSVILAERDYPEWAKAPPGFARRLLARRAALLKTPTPSPEPFLRIKVARDGGATACILSSTTGSDAADIAICRLVRETRDFVPERDQFGRGDDGDIHLFRWMSNPDGEKR